MAYPASRLTMHELLTRANQQANSIKQIAANNRDRMASGPITAEGTLALLDNLMGARSHLANAAARPNIAPYAQTQMGGDQLDVVASFNAMMAALDDAIDWIVTNFPRSADGALLTEELASDGTRTERTFSTAQTAGLRTALDALIATID